MRIPKTTLEQWQILKAIVDRGGYAQAAEALHRSQSSVSYMVARLQEQLGVDLLVIAGRKAQLTQSGKALLANATELLADAQSLERLAGSLARGWEPVVRLVVDVAFPTPMLLRALGSFTRIAEQTRVQLKEVVLSGAEETLHDNTADLVIGTQVPPGYLGSLLLDIELVAVAHPEHSLHRLDRELDAEDLRRELQIVLSDSGKARPRDDGWLGTRQSWTVTSMETSAAMVASGLGFAWLPRHVIRPRLDAGSLLPLRLPQGGVRRVPLYLIFGAGPDVGPATRQLAQVLEHEAAGSHDKPPPSN